MEYWLVTPKVWTALTRVIDSLMYDGRGDVLQFSFVA